MDVATVVVECSQCGNSYNESAWNVDWYRRHPQSPLLCLQCDPEAEQPALTRVTDEGWDVQGEEE